MASLVHCFNISKEELDLLLEVLDGKVPRMDWHEVEKSVEYKTIFIDEYDMNKAIVALTKLTTDLYLCDSEVKDFKKIDLATRLAGSFRRCLSIGVIN